MNAKRSLLSIAAILCGVCASAQTTWYVDISVPGPGTGTASDPYRTIKYALARPTTVAGDTLLVAPGTYTDKLSVNKAVTIRSTGGPLVTAIRPTLGGDAILIGVGGFAPAAIIEGFTIDGGGGTAIHANDAIVRRCIAVGGGGIGFAAIDLIQADHCTVQGFDIGCTGTVHGAEVQLQNSIVYANTIDLWEATATYTWYGFAHYGGASGLGAPGYFNGPGHDFHLLASSGCIDTGDPSAPLDPDGSRADMGAVPFDASYAPFTVYCTAKVNSIGCAPSIGAVNNASFTSARPFWISCSNTLNNKNGLFFYGFAAASTPFQGGWFCVQPPTKRTPLQNSGGNPGADDCSGTFAFEFNALLQAASDPQLELGAEIFCQYWSRDPAASFHNNRSDALRFTIGM